MVSVPTTLLCVTRELWARVDVDAEGRRCHAQIVRAASEEPVAALRQLLALGPPVLAECGILLDGVYTRTLDLETRVSELLPEHELARWLALRAEARCGIPAERAKVATTRHGVGFGERHRAVLAIADRTAVDTLAWTLNDAGAKRVWIASPAGRLGEYAEPVIEVWNGATFCGGASTEVLISGDPAGSKRWRRRVAGWLASVPHGRVRFHGRQADASQLDDPRLRVSGEVVPPEALLERLEKLARDPRDASVRLHWNFERDALARGSTAPAAPVAPPRASEPSPEPFAAAWSPPVSTSVPVSATSAVERTAGSREVATAEAAGGSRVLEAAALAIVLCMLLGWIYAPRLTKTEQVVAAEPDPAARALQRELELERGRQPALLDALYEEINDDVNLLGVRAERAKTVVEGLALDASRADAYAQALAKRLAPAGWRVGAADGRRCELDAGAVVWRFELPLERTSTESSR